MKKIINRLLLTLILFQSVGCSYFQYHQVTTDYGASINNIEKTNKYFIVHQRGHSEIYELIDITSDSMNISGNLIPIEKIFYYDTYRHPFHEENGGNRFIKEENNILHEVHIYLNSQANPLQLGHTDIPLTDLEELRIIEIDKISTVGVYIFGGLGIPASIVLFYLLGKEIEDSIYPSWGN